MKKARPFLRTAGLQNRFDDVACLKHAQHNGGHESESDIGCDDAQFACESHGNTPVFHVAARIFTGAKLANGHSRKKSVLLHRAPQQPGARG